MSSSPRETWVPVCPVIARAPGQVITSNQYAVDLGISTSGHLAVHRLGGEALARFQLGVRVDCAHARGPLTLGP